MKKRFLVKARGALEPLMSMGVRNLAVGFSGSYVSGVAIQRRSHLRYVRSPDLGLRVEEILKVRVMMMDSGGCMCLNRPYHF